MLTDNQDIGDKLINGLIGTVKHLDRVKDNNTPFGTIYVKFDDPQAGNKLKDRRLLDELKECVPIKPISKRFPYKHRGTTIIAERKQFPLILAHAMTIHKSQGSTLEYMSGDLNQTSRSGNRLAPIGQGMLYTLLSRAKSRDKLQLLNFDAERHIKTNKSAVVEMTRMRKECMLSWNHPLIEIRGNKICLFNIRSWNLHIQHFLSDKVYPTHSCIFCFTETYTNRLCISTDDNQTGWASIHRHTKHGLAICYDTTKVEIIQEFPPIDVLQLFPVVVKVENEHILLILVYRPPGPIGNFIQELIHQLGMLPTYKYRTMVVGDFNLDQLLSENVDMLRPLCTQFNFCQRSEYSTHIHGGILDLVFDNGRTEATEWMPSPYSDHFIILYRFDLVTDNEKCEFVKWMPSPYNKCFVLLDDF